MKAHPDTGLSTSRTAFRGAGAVACWGALACGLFLAAAGLQAQTLSSPLGSQPAPGKAKSAAAAAPSAAPGLDFPMGQGPGVHGANSPFPNLSARDDVVPWSVLTAVKTKNEKNRILPIFNIGQLALHQKTQRIHGFMMPLDPGEKQTHFLLSSVPLTCAFCLPG